MRSLTFLLSVIVLLSSFVVVPDLKAVSAEKYYSALNGATVNVPDQIVERVKIPDFYYQKKPASIYYSGTGPEKKIALTFDDGPDARYTGQILDILKRYNVSATFFVIGKQVQYFPEVVQRMVREGHVVAGHSWSHPNLAKLSDAQVRQEIVRTNQAVKNVTGKNMAMIRAPYGSVKGKEKVINQMGISIVGWNIDTWDWKAGRTPRQVTQAVLQNLSPGSIVLKHSGGGDRSATVQALPKIIESLQQKGYEFVTVNELLEIPAYQD
ncbi:MAG: polysaccharide deacetylase family protein [Thermoactinomyces sp.]